MTKNWAVIRRKQMAKDMKDVAEKTRLRTEALPVTPVEPPKPPKKPTKVAYRKALAEHDWDYEQADDRATWKRGADQRKALVEMQKVLDPDRVIWNKYAKRSTP
jgi:hypothetical protein